MRNEINDKTDEKKHMRMRMLAMTSIFSALFCGNVTADTLHFVNGAELVVQNGVLVEVHLNGATEISFSDGVKSIGDDAFRGCYGLRPATAKSSSATSWEAA